MQQLTPHSTLLFIGDSITDAGRQDYFGADLGQGYVNMVASHLYATYPDLHLRILNKGIGGNKMSDLIQRWQRDCLDHTPSVVSVLIGINDIWHRVSQNLPVSPSILQQFQDNYRVLLQSLVDRKIQIVVIEPYVLPYPEDRLQWRQYLDPMIDLTKALAHEFSADYVALDAYLNDAGSRLGYQAVTGIDGVHPTSLGHALICEKWLTDTGIPLQQEDSINPEA